MGILSTNSEILTFNTGTSECVVHYDVEQVLTDEQKKTAQDNIGANAKYATLVQVGSLNSAMYDINMKHNQLAAKELTDAGNIESNTKEIEELKKSISGVSTPTKIYHSGRGGGAQYTRMQFVDQYDGNGDGKSITLSRTTDDGISHSMPVGYTVSELGRVNAENCQDSLIAGNYNGISSNYNKLWFMPIYNMSSKGYIEGAITFTVNSSSSVSFMAIKCNGSYETANWNPGPDVMSYSTFQTGHPITVPFCWTGKDIYAIGIKGAGANDSITVNNYYVKFKTSAQPSED